MKKKYIKPEIIVTEVRIEKGFQMSSTEPRYSNLNDANAEAIIGQDYLVF